MDGTIYRVDSIIIILGVPIENVVFVANFISDMRVSDSYCILKNAKKSIKFHASK